MMDGRRVYSELRCDTSNASEEEGDELDDAEVTELEERWRQEIGLYPELPWTEEDEAAADAVLAKQIAHGDDGRPDPSVDWDARDRHLRREIAWVRRIYLMSEGLMTEDDDSHEASEGSGESEGEP